MDYEDAPGLVLVSRPLEIGIHECQKDTDGKCALAGQFTVDVPCPAVVGLYLGSWRIRTHIRTHTHTQIHTQTDTHINKTAVIPRARQ